MVGLVKLRAPNATFRIAVAARYWHAARIVLEHQIRPVEFWEPTGHLLSMSAELTLKAYLLDNGHTNRTLKNPGHDLGKLLRLCVEAGLYIGEDLANVIMVMRTGHLEHFHRYGPEDVTAGGYSIRVVAEEAALPAVAGLIDLVSGDRNTLRKLHGRPIDLEWPETFPPLISLTTQRLDELLTQQEADARQVEGIGVPHRPNRR